MKLILLTLILNLVGFASHAAFKINCTNGVNLNATSVSFAGSINGFHKGQFVVRVSDKSSGINNILDQLAGNSSCSITPQLPLNLECAGGPKIKIYMATFTPTHDYVIMHSIFVKTGNYTFSNIYDLVRLGTASKHSIACMIY